ncbi:MAG: hypothetical protein RBS88_02795 [Spongiibacteraceae bacterium]|jgi:hypothetical protein|nr:hypothetical protein [Spongiibacteraceae bacterium]
MKASRLIIACGITALLAGPALAEKPRQITPEDRAGHMQKVLQLDDQQREQIAAILAQAGEKRAAAASKYTIAERKAFHEEMRGVHKETRTAIDAVLTEPQKTALKAMHGKRGKGMHGHHLRHGDRTRT